MSRSQTYHHLLLVGLVAVGLARALTAAPPLSPEPHYGRIARRFARVIPKEHLTRHALDDDISRRAWTNYLASLDYDRIYFLESDIDAFRIHDTTLDDQIKAGDLSFAYEVFEIFKDRVRNRIRYATARMKEPFDLTRTEDYTWKRKDAPWPRGRHEWDELWRKRLKNEFVRRAVAKSMAEEQAGTNRVEATDAPPITNGLPVKPEEAILEEYRQYGIILEDSDAEWVLQRYLTAFAQAYDPHSDYLSPSMEEDFEIEMKLSLVGIGALLRSEDGAAKIVRLIPGGPADRVKGETRLQPGDRIVAVNQGRGETVSILHWPLNKVVKLIRGEKGSPVVLTVVPASDPAGTMTRQVTLIRDEVKLEEQAAQGELHEITDREGTTRSLGMITVPAFYSDLKAQANGETDYRSSTRDVARLLGELAAQGAEGMILDLRGNGGGSLPESVDMTGLFIESGPIVQVKERFDIDSLPDLDPRVAYEGPLVVLVSRLSASASEILAAALQDYGRAIVVGDSKTHGKGTVQSVERMGFDSRMGSVKLTKWMFFRVSGGSTQLRGVVPDIVVPTPFDVMEFGEEFLDQALPWSRVPAADYAPIGNPRSFVPLLRQWSLQRREDNPRFQGYTHLLERLRDMNAKSLPLNLEARKQLARTEKELTDLQDELGRQEAREKPETEEEDGDALDDLVLDESLHILADLILVEAGQPVVAVAASDDSQQRDPVVIDVRRLDSPRRRTQLLIARLLLTAGLVTFFLWFLQRRKAR